MAIYADLFADQGSYFSTVVDAAPNSVFDFDLTGYTARGTIRKSYSSATYYPFDISIPNPTNGKVTLSLSSELTGAIKAGRYLYDVEIVRTSDDQVTRIAEGQIEVTPGVTSSAYDPGNEVGQLTRDRLVSGLKKVILQSDGTLTVPGVISSGGELVNTWTTTVTDIERGTETIITLADNEFVAPITGQVIISGVQGATQANGTWYYQASNINQIMLYSDESAQTPIDSTTWNEYTTGGTVVNQSPPAVVLTAGSFDWSFDSSGELTLPTGGHLGFVGKGWTGLDGGLGNPVSVFSYYPNGNFSSCITPYSYGSVGITTYTDGDGIGGEWYFNADGGLSIPSGPGIIFDRNDTSISVGMGFHIRSGEGISLDPVDLTDPDNPITRGWHFATDGSVYVPTPNTLQYGMIKVSNLSDSTINWTFPNATGTLAILNDQDDGNITISDVSGLQSALDEQTFYTSSSDPTASNIADGTFEMWKNSNTNVLKLWANDGGTMKSITLT